MQFAAPLVTVRHRLRGAGKQDKTVSQAADILDPSTEDLGAVLPDNIGFHIRMVQMRIFRAFYRVFDGTGVTPGMHTVLAIIRDNPGVRQRTLAELLMVREPNMTRMIQGLEASGLIRREIDKSDRRAFHLALTEKGVTLMVEVAERINALEDLLLGAMTAAERRNLRDYLDRILASID